MDGSSKFLQKVYDRLYDKLTDRRLTNSQRIRRQVESDIEAALKTGEAGVVKPQFIELLSPKNEDAAGEILL